ncbi:MAG: hypothetical protein WB563_07505 [Pseudolabrys sp.]
METATFRKWLVEQGCRIDAFEHPRGHEGHGEVTVHREDRKARLPLAGAHRALDPRTVRRVRIELGLDPAQLPGPQSRV